MHYMGQLKLPAMLLRGSFFVIVLLCPLSLLFSAFSLIRQLFSRLYRGLTPQSWVSFCLLSSCGYFILPIAPIGVWVYFSGVKVSLDTPLPSPRNQNSASKARRPTLVRCFSPKASPKLTKAQREALKVSQVEHEIIVGGLLGDYYASRPNGPNRNTRLAIYRHNLGYLLSVYSLLSPLISQSEPTPYY